MNTASVLAATLTDGITVPSEGERDQVRAIAEALRQQSNGPAARIRLVLERDGDEVDLSFPPFLRELLGTVTEALDSGTGIAVLPLDEDLTTTQAADVLDVSRQYLQRLLDQGAIPYHKVGTHHRIKVRDVLAYRRFRDTERDQTLTDILRLGQELQG